MIKSSGNKKAKKKEDVERIANEKQIKSTLYKKRVKKDKDQLSLRAILADYE